MRSRIDFPSLLLGGLTSIVLVMLAGLARPQTVRSLSSFGQTLVMDLVPTARQMTRVQEDQPFVVPRDKLFVVSGVARGGPSGFNITRIRVLFDNANVYSAVDGYLDGTGTAQDQRGFAPVPPGLVAPGGTVVSVDDNADPSDTAFVLGYLADA